jgi:hypothetical protein
VQTDVTRRDRPAAERTQRTMRGSSAARRVPSPPATIRVSMGPRMLRMAMWGTSSMPLDMRSGPGSGATTVMS